MYPFSELTLFTNCLLNFKRFAIGALLQQGSEIEPKQVFSFFPYFDADLR